MDAAIYTRVSTDDQGLGASLTTQKTECHRYCKNAGLAVVAEFQDMQSGLKIDRVQYQEMLQQAQAGAFDVIVVWKLDRFGRDHLESGYQMRELQKVGVRVDSATEPNESPLLRNILMSFAEEESRRISLRVSANKRTLAQQGKRTSKAPFGYRNVGGRGNCTLEPSEDAPLVTEAFLMYASGKSTLADVRDYFNKHSSSPNCPKTRAGAHHLLRNPTYTGSIRHGFWARSKIQIKSKDERLSEVFSAEGLHPSLIDDRTFEKVQQRFLDNRPTSTNRPHTSFLFTGLIWCRCGHRFSGKTTGGRKAAGKRITYYCVRQNDAGDCDARSMSENHIAGEVIPPIQNLLGKLAKDEIRTTVKAEVLRQQTESEVSNQANKVVSTQSQERLENRLARIEDAYLDGDLPKSRYIARRDEITAQIKELQEMLAERPNLPNMGDVLELAESLANSVNTPALFESKNGFKVVPGYSVDYRPLIELLVERITIRDREIDVTWKQGVSDLVAKIGEVLASQGVQEEELEKFGMQQDKIEA